MPSTATPVKPALKTTFISHGTIESADLAAAKRIAEGSSAST